MRTHLTRAAGFLAGIADVITSAAIIVLIAAAMVLTMAAPASAATPAPAAAQLDTAADDATSEGTDVLPLAYHDAPAELWNALINQRPSAYDDDVPELPGMGTFYVPVGTVIDVPGGLYLATIDGFAECQDDWFDVECSAAGPVQMLDVPTRPASSFTPFSESVAVVNVAHATTTDQPTAQERKAARLILARMKSGKRIAEDWTWRGAPRVVGAHNDALLERFERTGLRFSKANQRAFLAKVAGSVPTDRVVHA